MTKKEILQKLVEERIDWSTIYGAGEVFIQRTKQIWDLDFTNDSEEEIFETVIDSLSGITDFLYDIQCASQQFDYYIDKVAELEEAEESEIDDYYI